MRLPSREHCALGCVGVCSLCFYLIAVATFVGGKERFDAKVRRTACACRATELSSCGVDCRECRTEVDAVLPEVAGGVTQVYLLGVRAVPGTVPEGCAWCNASKPRPSFYCWYNNQQSVSDPVYLSEESAKNALGPSRVLIWGVGLIVVGTCCLLGGSCCFCIFRIKEREDDAKHLRLRRIGTGKLRKLKTTALNLRGPAKELEVSTAMGDEAGAEPGAEGGQGTSTPWGGVLARTTFIDQSSGDEDESEEESEEEKEGEEKVVTLPDLIGEQGNPLSHLKAPAPAPPAPRPQAARRVPKQEGPSLIDFNFSAFPN